MLPRGGRHLAFGCRNRRRQAHIASSQPARRARLRGRKVQGEGAPAELIEGLRRAAASRRRPTVFCWCAAAALEDLMTFNDEELARAVAACPVPVVTGIGHEPDTSICDMVSDRRASTPTAAAESVAPAMTELADV
ncbi:MAG: exodeoxyribonuclease VII large subunit [Collinsella sp.]